MGNIRLSGMISGMDTDSIIKELVNAQKLKNKKTTDKLTLSEWKEDKWKELNTKLFNLYKTSVSKMRMQGSYLTKKISLSDESIAKITGSTNAPEGSHKLSVNELASAQYVTGGKLATTAKPSSSLTTLGVDAGTVIEITNGSKKSNLVVTSSTTIQDFVNTCNGVGLNASFDEKNQRFFINSKTSGADSAFSIKTGSLSSDGINALNDINSLVGLSGLTSAQKSEVTAALTALEGPKDSGEAAAYQAKLSGWYQQALNGQIGDTDEAKEKIKAINTLINYTKTQNSKEAATEVKKDIGISLIAGVAGSTDEEKRNTVVENAILKRHAERLGKDITDDEVKAAAAEEYGNYVQSDKDVYFNQLIQKEYVSTEVYTDGDGNPVLDEETSEPLTKAQYYQKQTELKAADYNSAETGASGILLSKLSVYTVAVSPTSGDSPLSKIGLGEIDGLGDIIAGDSSKLSVKKASDAEINLDGATITASTNSITVNGLTINLLGKTQAGKELTIDVAASKDDNYEMVKEFINGYNDILKEMNNLYYAASTREYAPLSDDEKEAMTEEQVKKWETKIKDSILRRDDSLGAMIETMKSAMMSNYTTSSGKTYSLASFGIVTSTDYTEKGLLHIYGNKDDATYPDEKDKLKAALTDDPEGTAEALAGIFTKLYDNMYSKFKSIPNVSSANTAFNDKLLDNEQAAYKKRIKVLEDKLTAMENKYYKQFSAMEKAMAKLQSQSNSLAGLLGNSNK